MTCYNNNLDEEMETQIILSTPMQICLNHINIIDITISNIVSSFNVKTHLNLRHLALNGLNVEYRRDKGQLIMKLRKPPTTASIWSSGKIVCVGTPSECEAKIAAKRIARIIQRLGYPRVKFSDYKTINVLGSCTLPFLIKIIPFLEKYKSNTEYEPELNPGVTYRIKEFKATVRMYSTGSVTVNAKNSVIVKQAIEHMYPLILPFSRSKLLEDKRLKIGKIQDQEQNTEILGATEDHLLMYHRLVDVIVNDGQTDTDIV